MLAVHAKHAVFTSLGALNGVTGVEVELGRAVLDHEQSLTEEMIRSAISASGLEVTQVRQLTRVLPMLSGEDTE